MGSVAAVLFDCRGSGDYGFYVFTDLSALPTVSDGHIFLQTKKDGATGGRLEKRMPVNT